MFAQFAIQPPPPPQPTTDTITVTTSHDYRGSAFFDISEIKFAGFDFERAIFDSTQFGTGLISDSVHVTGDSFRNFIDVYMSNGDTEFSAANWTFTDWVPFNPLQNDQVDIYGTDASDHITGSIMADSLVGNDGDDVLAGLDGEDYLIGGNGSDTLIGGNGDDHYRLDNIHALQFQTAGAANSSLGIVLPKLFAFDTVVEDANGGTDAVELYRVDGFAHYVLPDNVENGVIFGTIVNGELVSPTMGQFTLTGNGLANVLTGNADANVLNGENGRDSLVGAGGDDSLDGGRGGDVLRGGSGHDLLNGGSGNDKLFGGGASDVLIGGPGSDHLEGGAGRDTLTGGGNDDIFVFAPGSGQDTITHFADQGKASDDLIDATGFGFGDVHDIGRSASGNDLILDFGNGDGVTIIDYLETHSANAILDDILIA